MRGKKGRWQFVTGTCHIHSVWWGLVTYVFPRNTPTNREALVLLFRNAQLGSRRNEKQIKTLYISGGYNCRVERGSVFLGLLHKLLCKSTRMEKRGRGERRMYKYIMKEKKSKRINRKAAPSFFFFSFLKKRKINICLFICFPSYNCQR